MNTIKNSSMFITPNSLQSLKSDLWQTPLASPEDRRQCLNFEFRTREMKPWGIDVNLDDVFVQVWIHEDEPSSNLSDHGFDADQIRELFPKSTVDWKGDRDSLDRDQVAIHAPCFLPVRLFDGKKEGDSITLTSVDGVRWEIKLEQLPYRYGHFGRFEEVLSMLVRKDLVHSSKMDRYADYLISGGMLPGYTEGDFALILQRLELTYTVDRDGSYGDYVDVRTGVYKTNWNGEKYPETIRIARIKDGVVETLQHNLAEAHDRYPEAWEKIAKAFRPAA